YHRDNMKLTGIDNREYKVSLYKYLKKPNLSGPAERCYNLLREIFPLYQVCFEVPLPGCPTRLYLDFLLPQIKLAVEVHGGQHRGYTKHFHGSLKGFAGSLSRDSVKEEF